MKKKNLLLTLTFIGSAAGLIACGETGSSLESSSPTLSLSLEGTTSASEATSVSSKPVVPTAELTDAMFAELKKGYSVESFTLKDYSDSQTYSIFEADVNEFNYAERIFMTTSGSPLEKGKVIHDYHYQPDPSEKTKMLYDAGLSVGNTVIYSPIMGEDPHTYEEVPLTWEEGYYSNVFLDLSASAFDRVGTENKFSLIMNDATLEARGVYNKISMQFFNEIPDTEMQEFYLYTDGDDIVSFELIYTPYMSYDAMIAKSSFGNFTAAGSDVVDYIQPLEGEKDPVFEEAMKKLRRQNYELVQTQQAYDFNQEKFVSQGSYVSQVENGEKINYDYYAANGSKYMNYGYYGLEYENETCKQGVVQLKGEFYKDYIYVGSMEELLPSFALSSILFKKDASSTADKSVYTLDKSIRISLENNDSVFTPFDADGYLDRLVYVTVTIEAEKINIHNETVHEGAGGLILDCTYSNFDGVSDLMPEEKIHETSDGLVWSDLLSNNEENLKSIIRLFTQEVLDDIPTIGGVFSNVMSDVSSSANPIFYVMTYSSEDNDALVEEYSAKLLDAGYTANQNGENVNYTKPVTLGTRNYNLNINVSTFWNRIQLWGQFQIGVWLTSR